MVGKSRSGPGHNSRLVRRVSYARLLLILLFVAFLALTVVRLVRLDATTDDLVAARAAHAAKAFTTTVEARLARLLLEQADGSSFDVEDGAALSLPAAAGEPAAAASAGSA